jgi:phosphomevalonate kinase
MFKMNQDLQGIYSKLSFFAAFLLSMHREEIESVTSTLNMNFEVELKGDNGFYSQRDYCDQTDKRFCLGSLKDQLAYHVPNDPKKKTGLGSSAALVVSYVTCLL